MPIETRTIKQGIPPRLRSPARKKPKAKKGNKKPIPKKRKRLEVSENDESDSESSSSESDNLELKTRKKRGKRQWVQVDELSNVDSDGLKKSTKHGAAKRSEQEVEVVETMAAEEVESVVNNQADEEEVGICFIEKCVLHSQNDRMTGSITSNEGTTSNRSQ